MSLPKHVTTEELAEVLGCTARRIRQLADDGKIPKAGRNQFLLVAGIQAFIAWQKECASTEAGSSEADYERERARLTKAKADKAELEAGLMAGTLHEASAVASVVNPMLANFRQRMLAVPSKCAPLVADLSSAQECFGVIEREIHDGLAELSNYDPAPVVKKQREEIAAKADEEEP